MQKETKKILSLSALSLSVISLFSSFALAAAITLPDSLTSFLSSLFSQKEVLTKFFFAILLFMIIYSLVGMMFKGKWLMTAAMSAIITILAVWFMPPALITTIRDQYGVMGAAILSMVPFVIMLIFTVRSESKMLSRILWIFWIVYYFAVYLYRIFSNKLGWLSAENIVYLGAIIAGILMIVFISQIRQLIYKGELEAEEEKAIKDIQFRQLGRKIERAEAEARIEEAKKN